MELNELWGALGLDAGVLTQGDLEVHSPIDGAVMARVKTDSAAGLEAGIARADAAFVEWRGVPAPRRGELIRLFAEELRAHKEPLGGLVTLECGKILQEGLGEVQEMIDICDFAVGLSRQLHGLTIASERPGHRMMETWHPLGAIGVITAFNFPVAVWAWNFALAVVCGDSVVWKPSEKTPLSAFACRALFARACARFGGAPEGLAEVVVGDAEVGERLVDDRRLKLISATGSCRMGRRVGPRVAARLGRTLLELGGNNAMIVGASADLDLAVRAIVFAAVGTAGQRCTSLRRLIVHEDVYGPLLARLKAAYESISIGDPRDPGTLVGPLIEGAAFESMEQALAKAAQEGGAVFGGARVLEDRYPGAYYVEPAIVEMETQTDIVRAETFAPVLYVLKYRALDEAIAIHNDVPQGLSSAIFTRDLNEAEALLA
ncbi:MAG: aldehyde dehydrogenase family protein, partial [Proteobacteria bacterium]|nr:aldehyde dehydrogenase family protein [Pseudomonadota bacterium]